MPEDTNPLDGRATQVTSALWTFLAAISGVKDERERARLTATGLPSVLPCQFSGLAILNESDQAWKVALQHDGRQFEPHQTDEFLPDIVSLSHEAFRRPRLLSLTLDGGVAGVALPGRIKMLGVGFLAVVPLRTLDSRFGTIFIGRTSSSGLSRLEQSILLTLASHLSAGIENIRLYGTLQHYTQNLEGLVAERTDKLRKAEERWRVLLEITNAIVANLDRKSLFGAVAQALQGALTFDTASVALCTPGRDVLQVYDLSGTYGANEPPPDKEIKAGSRPLEKVFARRRPILCRDAETDRVEAAEIFLGDGTKAYVAVPFVKRGETFGSLTVGSRTANRYTDTDAEFVAEVGQQVALAVDNMLAYEEITSLKSRLEQENLYLQEEIETQHNFGEMVGSAPAIQIVKKAIATVAATDANVVITGETGTGKELVARALHNLSARSAKTLIKVNCAAIQKDLFESEFFGHVRGAFTGASRDRLGRFELAHQGTLFLDEVGEIPIDMQGKLLRVLQEGEFERVGEERTRTVDVRVVAATNRDLKHEVETGRFRQDLYYRLNVFPIDVPALRDRAEDIPLLTADFLHRAARQLNRPNPVLTQAGLQQLLEYPWPGNVRELQNTLERAMITSVGAPLRFDLATNAAVPLGRQDGDSQDRPRERDALPDVSSIIPESEWRQREKENVLAALHKCNWRIAGRHGAAALLGLKPATLTSRMNRMGLKRGS